VFRHIFAHGYFFEILNLLQMLNLQLQRQMIIAALLVGVIRIINVEPLLYPCVHAKELNQYLITLNIVQYVEVDEIGDKRRQSKLNIEACFMQLFDGSDAF
jgi:hypothetical protein